MNLPSKGEMSEHERNEIALLKRELDAWRTDALAAISVLEQVIGRSRLPDEPIESLARAVARTFYTLGEAHGAAMRQAANRSLEPGDIVQLAPKSYLGCEWGPQLVIVTEVRAWGVVGYFVHARTRGEFGAAYLRIPGESFERVGRAAWTIQTPEAETQG